MPGSSIDDHVVCVVDVLQVEGGSYASGATAGSENAILALSKDGAAPPGLNLDNWSAISHQRTIKDEERFLVSPVTLSNLVKDLMDVQFRCKIELYKSIIGQVSLLILGQSLLQWKSIVMLLPFVFVVHDVILHSLCPEVKRRYHQLFLNVRIDGLLLLIFGLSLLN